MADSNITKKALGDAMKSLMAEKPFAKISISDICQRCSMNRQSFYYHFRDKYDLVNWIFYTELIQKLQENPTSDGWVLLQDVCSYFYENRPFYVNALQVTGQNAFIDYFADVLHAIVQPFFEEIFHEDEAHLEFYVQLFTDVSRAAIKRWLLDEADIEPSEFVRLVRHAVISMSKCVMREQTVGEEKESF